MRGVAWLDGFAELGGGGVGRLCDVDGFRFGLRVVERNDVGALALDGGEDLADLVCFGIDEIRAGERGDGELAVDDKGKGDGVLVFAEEAFGAIDRVECPEAVGIFGMGAAVDPLADGVVVGEGVEGGGVLGDLGEQVFVLREAEFVGGFLSDDRIIGEGLCEGLADERLGAEVGDGDRGFIFFFQDRVVDLRLDGAAEGGGLGDGLCCGGEFVCVGLGHVGSR